MIIVINLRVVSTKLILTMIAGALAARFVLIVEVLRAVSMSRSMIAVVFLSVAITARLSYPVNMFGMNTIVVVLKHIANIVEVNYLVSMKQIRMIAGVNLSLVTIAAGKRVVSISQ